MNSLEEMPASDNDEETSYVAGELPNPNDPELMELCKLFNYI